MLRAEDGAQTRDPQLGRLMLYQLSYFRKIFDFAALSDCTRHSSSELGSALVGTTIPLVFLVGKDGFEPPKAYASRFTVCPIWPLWYLPKPLLLSPFRVLRLQSYNYLFKLQTKSIIFIAVIAHSSPLLPSLPPALSSACSIVLVVINP